MIAANPNPSAGVSPNLFARLANRILCEKMACANARHRFSIAGFRNLRPTGISRSGDAELFWSHLENFLATIFGSQGLRLIKFYLERAAAIVLENFLSCGTRTLGCTSTKEWLRKRKG
jgi:hypothetical protein